MCMHCLKYCMLNKKERLKNMRAMTLEVAMLADVRGAYSAISCGNLLRYSVAFLIDSISNGYTLITIHELKPWVFFAFKTQCHVR